MQTGLPKIALPLAAGAFAVAASTTLYRPSFTLAPVERVVAAPAASMPAPSEAPKLAEAPAPAPGMDGRSARQDASSLPLGETEKLYRRGQALIGVGDFAAARLLLSRASEAGHAGAIFALASTYDPNVLAKVKVKGLVGEPEKAKELYARALAEGLQDARVRMAALGG